MKTATSSKKTPELILDTAEALMLARGFHGVSVDTIIEQSGISKGTFFYHFKSKEALSEKLLQRFVEGVGSEVTSIMDEIKSENLGAYDSLIRFLQVFPERTECKKGCLMAAFSYQLLEESPTLKQISLSAFEGWKAFFTPFIAAAFEEKNIELNFDPGEIAQSLLCIMEGAFVTVRIGDQDALSTQFKHLRQYIELLALPAKG